MADQLNQVPTSSEPIGTFGKTDVPVQVSSVWYKFFVTLSGLFSNSSGGGSGASAILDTLGDVVGGMLSRFGTGWHEFVASAPNQIPVMNPNVPITLKTVDQLLALAGATAVSQLLDQIGTVQGDILFRGAGVWQVLAPAAGNYLQSQGPGVDPHYVSSTAGATVATGLVATGTVQGDALVLTKNWNEIDTTPVNSGVAISSLGVGLATTVFNQGANSLKVYPPIGGQIDALGINSPYALAASKMQLLFQLTATQWRTTQLG